MASGSSRRWSSVDSDRTPRKKFILKNLFIRVNDGESGGRLCIVLLATKNGYAYLINRASDHGWHTVLADGKGDGLGGLKLFLIQLVHISLIRLGFERSFHYVFFSTWCDRTNLAARAALLVAVA